MRLGPYIYGNTQWQIPLPPFLGLFEQSLHGSYSYASFGHHCWLVFCFCGNWTGGHDQPNRLSSSSGMSIVIFILILYNLENVNIYNYGRHILEQWPCNRSWSWFLYKRRSNCSIPSYIEVKTRYSLVGRAFLQNNSSFRWFVDNKVVLEAERASLSASKWKQKYCFSITLGWQDDMLYSLLHVASYIV